MKNKILRVLADLGIVFIYLKIMENIQEINAFSFATGASIILIWILLDAIRGDK